MDWLRSRGCEKGRLGHARKDRSGGGEKRRESLSTSARKAGGARRERSVNGSRWGFQRATRARVSGHVLLESTRRERWRRGEKRVRKKSCTTVGQMQRAASRFRPATELTWQGGRRAGGKTRVCKTSNSAKARRVENSGLQVQLVKWCLAVV